jgi:hypothetical protein
LVIAGLSFGIPLVHANSKYSRGKLSFGIVTDAHYADAEPNGTRRYRESIAKMNECVTLMNDKKVDFLIELGDLKDQGDPTNEDATLKYLTDIEKVYGQSSPSGAKLYMNGEPVGTTPYTHTDTKIVGSTTILKITSEGYEDFNGVLKRDEEVNVGAIIGGIFLLFPFLWVMDYKPTHNFELVPVQK